MNKEEKIIKDNESPESSNLVQIEDPVETILKLKQNTVPKEEYEKVVQERNRAYKALADGEGISLENQPKRRTAEEIRKELFNGKRHNNLKSWELALELRSAELEENGRDIFVGEGVKYNPTVHDFESAQRVADVVQECIEYAEGNSELFTQELSRRTNNSVFDKPLPKRI